MKLDIFIDIFASLHNPELNLSSIHPRFKVFLYIYIGNIRESCKIA